MIYYDHMDHKDAYPEQFRRDHTVSLEYTSIAGPRMGMHAVMAEFTGEMGAHWPADRSIGSSCSRWHTKLLARLRLSQADAHAL